MNTLLIYHLMVHDYALCSLGRDPIELLKKIVILLLVM